MRRARAGFQQSKRLALLALVAPACLSCAQRVARPDEHSTWVNGFVFGLFGSRAVDVRDLCRSGRAEQVRVEQTGATVGLTVLTVGLYTPRRLTVRCRP